MLGVGEGNGSGCVRDVSGLSVTQPMVFNKHVEPQVCRLAEVLDLSAIEIAREPMGTTKLGGSWVCVALLKPELARTELFNTGLGICVTT